MDVRLGVDFGTTNTRIAVRPEGQEPTALNLGDLGERLVPSVVALHRNTKGPPSVISVGEEAARLQGAEDILVLENLKRCLTYRVRPEQRANLPAWWDRDRQVVIAWGYELDPAELVVTMLQKALESARRSMDRDLGIVVDQEHLNEEPITLGCPAYSGYAVHAQFRGIAQALGNKSVRLSDVVEEPSLAAMAYARLREISSGGSGDSSLVLIYDLGGGSFDTAVVEVTEGRETKGVTILGSDCLPFTGGSDIDHHLLDILVPRIAADFSMDEDVVLGCLLNTEMAALQRSVREAKEALCTSGGPETRATLQSLAGQHMSIGVHMSDVNEAVKRADILEATLAACRRAYTMARMYLDRKDVGGFRPELDRKSGKIGTSILNIVSQQEMVKRLDSVILVGGSTKIPKLREDLIKVFGKDKIVTDSGFMDPLTVNAIGATFPDENRPAQLRSAPYWIRVRHGSREATVYQPFDSYVRYEFPEAEITEEKRLDFTGEAKSASVVIQNCDDEEDDLGSFEIPASTSNWFAFDRYGAVHICNSMSSNEKHNCNGEHDWSCDNPPWQHPYQRRMQAAERGEDERKESERKQRLNENLRHSPYEDVN